MFALLTKFKGYVIAIVSAVMALLGVYLAGKASGKSENEASSATQKIKDAEALAVGEVNRSQAASERETETIRAAKDASDETLSIGVDDVVSELQRDWARPDDDTRSNRS